MASSAPAAAAAAAGAAAGTALRLGLVQLLVTDDKAKNLQNAATKVAEAATNGANIVVLPEVFNSPYSTASFPEYAEPVPEVGGSVDAETMPTSAMLSAAAREHGIYLVGGSFPEQATGKDAETHPGKSFNTCTVWSPEGALLVKFRKVHLFDIDIPGKMTFKESDTLGPGDRLGLFDTPWGRVGLGICYDIRFPQLAMALRQRGAQVLIYPGAFNTTTGPKHWELLQRARAVDNQCIVATCSPARNPDASYQAWGHSTVVSPWGAVVATCDHQPTTVYADVDVAETDEFRTAVPLADQLRHDLYEFKWVGAGDA